MKFVIALRTIVFSAAAAMTVAAATAQDSLSVQQRLMYARSSSAVFASSLYDNPALTPLSLPQPVGKAGVGYTHRHGSRMALSYDPDQGESLWQLQAEASAKVGGSSVWGHAAYENGRHLDRSLCLGSDYDMIYPYVSATLTGGDMRQEHYRFGGGWGGSIAPRWRIGATFGYDAGHAYRSIDPRPRNITGLLRLGFGAAFRLDDRHWAGLNLTLNRYTQSNSTTFVSEMGQEMIYHLTGLATQYRRFAGLGPKMNYSSYEPGVALQFMSADGSGFFASAGLKYMHMRCLLTALNRLPMACIDRNIYEAQVGWMGRKGLAEYGAATEYVGSRRYGEEGIFGDPVSGIYPRIGTQRMYTDAQDRAELSLFWRYGTDRRRVTLRPLVAWTHNRESYDGDARLLRVDRWLAGVQAQGEALFGKFFASLRLKADFYLPSGSELRLPVDGSAEGSASAITDAMLDMERKRFRSGSEALRVLDVSFNIVRAVGFSQAIGLGLQWNYADSAADENFNTISANINFYF